MYKQTKSLQPKGKMAVTPEQSEAVQKVLFEMGYGWLTSPERTPKMTKEPFIFWKDYISLGKTIAVETIGNKAWFDKSEKPLHIFTDYFTTEPLK